jgi:hypothetical protein
VKKLTIILALSFLIIPEAFSYSIIREPDLFYSFFEKPMTTIDFSALKDGTPYEKIQHRIKSEALVVSEPQCTIFEKSDINLTDAGKRIPVRSNAFSNEWLFSVENLISPEVSCEAVLWFNQGISAGGSKIIVTSSSGKSEPFVLYTNKGFIGVVPDNPKETEFIFDNFSAIFSFESNFLRPSTTLNTNRSLMAQLYIQ